MPLTAYKSAPLRGRVRVPGDKSISHRALIFGAMASGETRVTGLLEADDVLRTAAALRALGAEIEKNGAGDYSIRGGGLHTPERVLYAGNAGTGVRLLMGAVAGMGYSASFDGDASLRKRPMERVLQPLRQMGVRANSVAGKLPVEITASSLSAIRYRLPVPSAQIKSAILLAALGASGNTVIEEPVLCRDHTERMLEAFGVSLQFAELEGGGRTISLEGGQQLVGTSVAVPADPSSAAFPVVAALLVPDSDIIVEGVLLNPLRTGLFDVLLEMGAKIEFLNRRLEGGESVADLRVRHSHLKGIEIPSERAPSMIDEYPILSIAASAAEGETRMNGLEELRVKESDRLSAISAGLSINEICHHAGEDWLAVTGGEITGGGEVTTHLDHRIAMSFLVLGMISKSAVTIDSAAMINTSFPGFADMMQGLGAKFS